jgi:hypothetical protein
MSTAAIVETVRVARPRSLAVSIARIALLVLVFSASAVYESARLSAFSNTEVWLHLRTGLWILQNHAFPRSGLFSQYPHLPWMATSWGFDVLLTAGYKLLGLRAIPLLLMILKMALAVVIYLLARSARAGFWPALVLCAIGQYVIVDLQPTPASISIVCFAIELLLLIAARRSGNGKLLYWLPLLFLFWANVHLQFVMGLVLLALFCVAVGLESRLRDANVRWLDSRIHPLPLRTVGVVASLSWIATFLTPYTFHLLTSAYRALYSDVAFQYFAEMRSMSFRRPQDFALMLLVMGAFARLGRNRRIQLFELAALMAGTLVAFRIQRDAWVAILPAIAIVVSGFRVERDESLSRPEPSLRWEKSVAAGMLAAVLMITAFRIPVREALMSEISGSFPVKACDYIAQNHLPAPLLNAYAWGSFLTWYLPDYPVAIDARLDLYGDEVLGRYFKVTGGSERLDADPTLASARTILLERQSGMAKALTNLPALSAQYRLVYSDNLAAVFVRQ